MHQLNRQEVDTLLEFLDTLATLDLSPKCTVIWHSHAYFYPSWSFTTDTAKIMYDVSVRDDLRTCDRYVLDIAEKLV